MLKVTSKAMVAGMALGLVALTGAVQARETGWNGSWVGKTEQGRTVRLTVTGGEVASYMVDDFPITVRVVGRSASRLDLSTESGGAEFTLRRVGGNEVSWKADGQMFGSSSGVLYRR